MHDGKNVAGAAVTGDEEGIRIDALHDCGGRHGWTLVQSHQPTAAPAPLLQPFRTAWLQQTTQILTVESSRSTVQPAGSMHVEPGEEAQLRGAVALRTSQNEEAVQRSGRQGLSELQAKLDGCAGKPGCCGG